MQGRAPTRRIGGGELSKDRCDGVSVGLGGHEAEVLPVTAAGRPDREELRGGPADVDSVRSLLPGFGLWRSAEMGAATQQTGNGVCTRPKFVRVSRGLDACCSADSSDSSDRFPYATLSRLRARGRPAEASEAGTRLRGRGRRARRGRWRRAGSAPR